MVVSDEILLAVTELTHQQSLRLTWVTCRQETLDRLEQLLFLQSLMLRQVATDDGPLRLPPMAQLERMELRECLVDQLSFSNDWALSPIEKHGA